MTPDDDIRDEELLARYRRASTDVAAPSDAVRATILAESRRVAAELAKQVPKRPFAEARPAANDSRWKIPAFGTAGAAVLAALLFAPRYWENAPPAQVSVPPASAPAPQLEEVKPYAAASNAQAQRKSSKTAGAPTLNAAVPAPTAQLSAAQNDAPASPPASAGRARPPDLSTDSALQPPTLESAVAKDDVAQAAALLDKGAVIDIRDEAGRTPLMLAVTQDRLEMVRLLLARGADPNVADNTGHTPLQQATIKNLQDVVVLLEQAGAH